MTFFRLFSISFLFLLLFSCKVKVETPLFELQTHSGIVFENTLTDEKSDNIFLFRNYYNGGGVAIGDINNDGLPDVFMTANTTENKLFLNKGNMTFTDITGKSDMQQDSMWSTGVVMVDINQDGWLDIYVCNSGHMSDGNRRNKLYINNHDLTFTESASKYGLAISAYTTQVSFFDSDNDGDLDCFMIDNSPIPINTLNNSNRRDLPDSLWPIANNLKGGGDHLYRNDNGHFVEITQSAGIHGGLIGFGLGVSVGDVNGDGFADIFVSNDSYERDYLYINQKNGRFKDEFEERFGHTSYSSMGADIADINNDGYSEIFTTDMLPEDDYRLKTLGSFDNVDLFSAKQKAGFFHQYTKNCLQLNDRDGKFIDIANYSGVSATDWSWGALMFDMDNDGYNDIFVCNGINKDLTNLDFMDFFANDVAKSASNNARKEEIEVILNKIPVQPMLHKAYQNQGNLQFNDQGLKWGFSQSSFSNGAAYGDLDNDGDLDMVINNVNGPAFVYKNNSRELNKNNFVAIRLSGTKVNPFAVGSIIKLFADNQVLLRDVYPSRGFQSSVDYKQIIGLGGIKSIDSLTITWPDHRVTTLYSPKINKEYTLAESDSAKMNHDQNSGKDPLFVRVGSDFQKHIEDANIDYYFEKNVPKMLSREGPKAAVGDVNGDGLEDVFIGGTAGYAGQVYLQTEGGQFIKKAEPGFEQFSDFEDEAVLFFDADRDGDLDLFIGPGGNNNQPVSRQMQYRLFKNDGKGNFEIDASAFPNNISGANTAVAIANDFTGDGFEDLFVGARSVPREYGSIPQSFLFVNDGNGHFQDMAASKNPDISKIGMVTDAVWADVAGDKSPELIICGEWMSPRIFSFKNDHFIEVTTNLKDLLGWWEAVAVVDVNRDGKKDLVLGNIGENFYLHPDSADPVKLWVNDFDKNGNIDNVLTRSIDGKDMPVFLKHDMEAQIPSLKKQNLRHAQYAKKSIQDLFAPELLKKSQVRIFNYTPSVLAMNNGNGHFQITPLPQMTQMSSVNAIQAADVNDDGFTDLVLAGNEFGLLPQFGRLDGSRGQVLINNGKGGFSSMSNQFSGLDIPGQTRDIAIVNCKVKRFFLFLENDDYPVLYKLNMPRDLKTGKR